MPQGVRLRHVRLSPRDARVNDVGAPKYRTDARAWVWVRRAMQHKKESV